MIKKKCDNFLEICATIIIVYKNVGNVTTVKKPVSYLFLLKCV